MARNICLLALLMLASSGLALADGIVAAGTTSEQGTGFGSVTNVLTIQETGQADGTEAGSVSWNGSTDVLTGDAKNTSQTVLFSTLVAGGIQNGSQLGIVYNVSQQGSDLNTHLQSFTLQVYNLAGQLVYSSTSCVGCGNSFNYPPINQGTGGAGYVFKLDAAAI